MSTHRLISISDAIFSIVLTLAVFEIIPHDLAAKLQTEGALNVLQELRIPIAFVLVDFLIVGKYWLSHNRIFALSERADDAIYSINLFFLCSMCFVPFSTSLLNAPEDDRVAAALYALNFAVSGYALFALYWMMKKRGHLRDPQDTLWDRQLGNLIQASVFLISIALAYFSAAAAHYSWFLVLLARPAFVRRVRRTFW